MVGRVLNLVLHVAAFDGREGPAHLVYLLQVAVHATFDGIRKRLNGLASTDGVRRVGNAAFVSDHLLGAEGDARRFLGGQPQRLVARIGMQRLRAAQNGGHSLERGAHNVHIGLLGRESRPGGLRVESQH